jgi:hypothetical protein
MAKDVEVVNCSFCGEEFAFRNPQLDWPTPACDTCLVQNPSRGRVVRRVPAKHQRKQFDSAREVQRQIDWGNIQAWEAMREKFEAGQ